MAVKPIVLPDTFTGEASWDEWICHFENVSDVNGWDDDQKLKFLKVRLMGRAQKAFQHLNDDIRANYGETKRALRARFEPESKKTRYQSEFQCRRKKKTENWADYAEDLRALADKAFPELQDEARERLALNSYLNQLEHPQVAFGVKQRQPGTLDEAVTATLEMESYLSTKQLTAQVACVDSSEDPGTIAAVTPQDKLTSLVEKLLERVERLETNDSKPARQRAKGGPVSREAIPRPMRNGVPRPVQSGPNSQYSNILPRNRRGSFQGNCWLCGKKGHLARNCEEQVSKNKDQHHNVFQVNPSGGYRLRGTVNGTPTAFLVDTGAAVTLVRDDVWQQTATASKQLEPWTGCRLLSVDGSPLHIRGQTTAELEFEGKQFTTRVVIAASLSTEAIIGLDFLEHIQATIDLVNEKIILPNDGGHFLLQKGCTNTDDGACSLTVCAMETIQVPPSSEMEIMATVQGQPCIGPWPLEGVQRGRLPVVIARALVEPRAGCVPVRLVNPRSEPMTIYQNTTLATLEKPENLPSPGAVIASAGQGEVPKEKQEVLLDLVEKNGADLTGDQKDKFYTLLINYSSIFATTDLELGKTNKLRHSP